MSRSERESIASDSGIESDSESGPAFAGARVLVTGASGFIGSHLVRALAEVRAEVHAVSRRPRATRDEPTEGVVWHQADLTGPNAAARLIAEVAPRMVFHLASEVTGGRELALVLPTFEANLASTVRLLAAATESGVERIVLAGSVEEPDPASGEIPGSPYAAAKWAAAGYARMFHALYATPVVCARLFMVYGAAQLDLRKLVPYVTLALLRGEAPALSAGSRPVDWIHVDDAVAGLLLCARRRGLEGGVVELGSGEMVSVREVAARLHRQIGGPEPRYGALPDRPFERVRAAHLEETERRLGWRPRIGLDEGLAATVAWYRQHAGELAG